MDFVKLILSLLVGAAGGFAVPQLAQGLIDFKAAQKNREYPPQPKYLALWCKLLCAASSMIGLGACAWFDAPWHLLVMAWALWILGMVILLVDIRIRLIANETVLALLVLGLVFRLITAGFAGLPNSLLTMIGIMAVWLFLCKFMGFGSVGAGDVKLCGAIGFLFGYPAVATPILVMAITMLGYIGIGLLTRRINLKSFFPMAPFLVLGMLAGLPWFIYGM